MYLSFVVDNYNYLINMLIFFIQLSTFGLLNFISFQSTLRVNWW